MQRWLGFLSGAACGAGKSPARFVPVVLCARCPRTSQDRRALLFCGLERELHHIRVCLKDAPESTDGGDGAISAHVTRLQKRGGSPAAGLPAVLRRLPRAPAERGAALALAVRLDDRGDELALVVHDVHNEVRLAARGACARKSPRGADESFTSDCVVAEAATSRQCAAQATASA